MYEQSYSFGFEAAHELGANVAPGHDYSHIHGHSFRATVVLRAETLGEEGWVTDFAEVRAACDAVRERLAFLRDHPDLGHLEHDVMEVAAQMGEQARELADIYSDEKVARAKKFLAARQEDAERQQERIIEALHVCRELKRWSDQVELEESVVASQLAQLDDQLREILPELGYDATKRDSHTPEEDAPKVVNMKPAAE